MFLTLELENLMGKGRKSTFSTGALKTRNIIQQEFYLSKQLEGIIWRASKVVLLCFDSYYSSVLVDTCLFSFL